MKKQNIILFFLIFVISSIFAKLPQIEFLQNRKPIYSSQESDWQKFSDENAESNIEIFILKPNIRIQIEGLLEYDRLEFECHTNPQDKANIEMVLYAENKKYSRRLTRFTFSVLDESFGAKQKPKNLTLFLKIQINLDEKSYIKSIIDQKYYESSTMIQLD